MIKRSLAVLFVTACGATGEGAALTFEAPAESEATRIEIILASADPATISTVNQRIAPGDLTEAPVRYYRQRAWGGMVDNVGSLDGFVVRVEPDFTEVADDQFIPFVLAYDAANTLVAVGTVNDDGGNPAPVTIMRDAIIEYVVTMLPLAPAQDTGIGVGEGGGVACVDDAQVGWTSGAAWQPPTGPQLRLLLPDVRPDPAATDASARSADLDCDDHPAEQFDDCDDLRDAFHPGAAEVCDGLDTDCNRRELELVTGCPLPGNTCGSVTGNSGVLLCVDRGGSPDMGTCQPTATCACTGGNCNRCVLDYLATATANLGIPCAPAVGKLHPSCVDCTIDVIGTSPGWRVKLGLEEAGLYGPQIKGVQGYYYLRAERVGPAGVALDNAFGEVYLAITEAGAGPRLTTVALQRREDQPVTVCPTVTTGAMTDNLMSCSP